MPLVSQIKKKNLKTLHTPLFVSWHCEYIIEPPAVKTEKASNPPPAPHAVILLARLQSALQRLRHLLQRGHGGVQRLAGGCGGAEAVGVSPSVDEQEDASKAGVRLRPCR